MADEKSRGPQRRRRRTVIGSTIEKRTKIAQRVLDFYETERTNRQTDREHRLQLYAKYRMWTSPTDWPWPDAASTAVPDMFQDSNRIQDTLHNAVMSQRPPVVAKAVHKVDQDKEKPIDDLIQHQVFTEQPGERIVGEAIHNFINDPACISYTPWVRDRQRVADVQVFDPMPEDAEPGVFLFDLVRKLYPDAATYDKKGVGWDWDVNYQRTDGSDDKEKSCLVQFFTNEVDELEMVVEHEKIVYDGPCWFVKSYDDVIFPARSANLQQPSPSNPGGAAFVIVRDFPTIAEIKSLCASKYYDLPEGEDLAKIDQAPQSVDIESESEEQKDKLSGHNQDPGGKVAAHRRVTRLICFDLDQIEGEGKFENVIYWVIKETKTLLKARRMSDMYPGSPPKRPFQAESFIPVPGRVAGISLLETMEAVHDTVKVMIDQSINGNDLAIASPGFYRPAGGANPEVLKVEPYSLLPLQNPQQDITFPTIGNSQAMGMAFNMLSMLDAWQGKTTMVGDLQFGNVPAGGSSALRTTSNMAMMTGQGEARPERILRRFFMMLTAVWDQINRLNQSFLPKEKQFRIAGVTMPGQDPYRKISDKSAIGGNFQFEFAANVFNTSKAALQQGLGAMMGTFVNDLFIQMGVVTPENMYRLARDYARAQGQDADRYLTPPTPEAAHPRILAEEAVLLILQSQMPVGMPLEPGGYQEHQAKLLEFIQSPHIGMLSEPQNELLRAYLSVVQEGVAGQQRQQQMLDSARAFSQSQGGGAPGAPAQSVRKPGGGPPRISGPKELVDETAPGAGGGANG